MRSEGLADALKNAFNVFREKLLSGLLWNGLSTASLQGANLLASALLARLLGLESFGAYALLIATATTLANLAQWGSGFVITKLVSENLGVNPTGVRSALRLCALLTTGLGIISSFLLWLMAPEFGVYVLHRPELSAEIRWIAISIVFQVVITYQTGALQGFSAFRQLGRTNTYAGLISLVCLVTGAWLDGLVGALIGFTMATGLRSLLCGLALRRVRTDLDLTGSAPIRKNEFKHLWQLALPAGLAGLVTMPALWLVNLGLSSLPQGLSLVGVFSVAMQIRQVALQVPILLNAVTFAALGQAKGLGTTSEFNKLLVTNLWVNLLVGGSIALFMALAAEQLLWLWKISNAENALTVRILAASLIPELIAISAYQLVQSSGRMWTSLFQIAIPRDAAYLGLATWFMATHGVTSVALAYLAAQIIGLITTLTTVWQIRSKSS